MGITIQGQHQIAELFGVSRETINNWQDAGFPVARRGGPNLPSEYDSADCIRWLIAREVRSRREAAGSDELTAERARLAKEQADKIAMQNAERRGELAPVAAMEMVLAAVGAKVGRILDTIPGTIRRRAPGIGADVVEAIAADIAKCRNMAAAMRLEDVFADDADEGTEPADNAPGGAA